MQIKLLIAACALSLVPTLAHAQADAETREEERNQQRERRAKKLDYSFIEISSWDFERKIAGVNVEPDGYKLKLSLSLGDSLFGIIDRKRSDVRLNDVDYDFDTEGYGFGFRGDSWFSSYTYNTWEMGNNEFDVDTIRVGFRNKWTEHLEFSASYSWNNIEDADNDDGFQVGFAYEIFEDIDLIVDYETIGGHIDLDYVTAGIRLNF